MKAGLTEGVTTLKVRGTDEGLEADLAHEVLIHILRVLVEMRLSRAVHLATHYTHSLHAHPHSHTAPSPRLLTPATIHTQAYKRCRGEKYLHLLPITEKVSA